MSLVAPNAALKARLANGDTLFGTFVKTPHPSVFELLAGAGFDFLVLDAEHAPFDRAGMDVCILGALAWRCPVIVRVPQAVPGWINAALDCAAAGVMVPQVRSVAQASHAAGLVSHQKERGFSPSPRAGNYGGRSLAEHLERAGKETVLICQIEDREGVDAAEEIADVAGVDALFVGPADLAVSIGAATPGDERVLKLAEQVIRLAGGACRTGLFAASVGETERWRDMGGSLFVLATDQALLKAGARKVLG